jgi:hypothetical protein
MVYLLQVSPLMGSHDNTWRGQGMRKHSVSCSLPKLSQLWWGNRGFRPSTIQNHLCTKQFMSGTRNSSRVAACALQNEQAAGAIGQDCWACVRNFCQEPSEVSTAQARNCKCLRQVSGTFCTNVFMRKDTGCSCWLLRSPDKSFSHTFNSLGWWPQPACSFCSAQAATLLGFLVPLMNCFTCGWFCVVLGPKPPLCSHNWLSFGKFQDAECFLMPCPCHALSWLPSSGETCKYAMTPITQRNVERISAYWYATGRSKSRAHQTKSCYKLYCS